MLKYSQRIARAVVFGTSWVDHFSMELPQLVYDESPDKVPAPRICYQQGGGHHGRDDWRDDG